MRQSSTMRLWYVGLALCAVGGSTSCTFDYSRFDFGGDAAAGLASAQAPLKQPPATDAVTDAGGDGGAPDAGTPHAER